MTEGPSTNTNGTHFLISRRRGEGGKLLRHHAATDYVEQVSGPTRGCPMQSKLVSYTASCGCQKAPAAQTMLGESPAPPAVTPRHCITQPRQCGVSHLLLPTLLGKSPAPRTLRHTSWQCQVSLPPSRCNASVNAPTFLGASSAPPAVPPRCSTPDKAGRVSFPPPLHLKGITPSIPGKYPPLPAVPCWHHATTPTSLTFALIMSCHCICIRIARCRVMPPHHTSSPGIGCCIHRHVLPPLLPLH